MQFWLGQSSPRCTGFAHTALFEIELAHQILKHFLISVNIFAKIGKEFFQSVPFVVVNEMIKQLDRRHRAGEMIVEITSKCCHAKIGVNLHACSFPLKIETLNFQRRAIDAEALSRRFQTSTLCFVSFNQR